MPKKLEVEESCVKRLILASKSVYRRRSLESLGLVFEADSASLDEAPLKEKYKNQPKECSIALSIAKAKALEDKYSDAVIIGGDQVASCENEFLGKTNDTNKSIERLKAMRGKTIRLDTSLCVLYKGEEHIISVASLLKLRSDLSDQEIKDYVAFANPIDCAGSFKIELGGFALFESIECEDFSSIEGIPLIALSKKLRELSIPFFKKD
jgi:septum formation protein